MPEYKVASMTIADKFDTCIHLNQAAMHLRQMTQELQANFNRKDRPHVEIDGSRPQPFYYMCYEAPYGYRYSHWSMRTFATAGELLHHVEGRLILFRRFK
jgi:hypothetical protein